MSLTGKNDRSIHTDAERIRANLLEHSKRMATYQRRGMCKLHASKRAWLEMRGRIYEPSNNCTECSTRDKP